MTEVDRQKTGTLKKAAVALVAGLLTLGFAELASRIVDPHADTLPPAVWQGRPAGIEEFAYVRDRELGYRPVLGTRDYSPYGTLVNDHSPEKSATRHRLLFLGDSVARRQRLQWALGKACPGEPLEIWTAAVEGYNTVQEVAYYLRYAHKLQPDHLTLLFHNNDFLATPVVFEDENGELTLSIGEASLSRRERRLLQWSNLYRHFFKDRLRSLMERDPVTTVTATRAALVELDEQLELDGTHLTVVLLPIFAPYDEWSEREKRHRERGLALLEELGVEYFDLFPELERALAAGVRVSETPGDDWHPSRQAARRFVRYLLRNGYLRDVVGLARCRS